MSVEAVAANVSWGQPYQQAACLAYRWLAGGRAGAVLPLPLLRLPCDGPGGLASCLCAPAACHRPPRRAAPCRTPGW